MTLGVARSPIQKRRREVYDLDRMYDTPKIKEEEEEIKKVGKKGRENRNMWGKW